MSEAKLTVLAVLVAFMGGIAMFAACSRSMDMQLDATVVTAPDSTRASGGPVSLLNAGGQCVYFGEEVAVKRAPRNWREQVAAWVHGGALNTWQVHLHEADCADSKTRRWERRADERQFELFEYLKPGDRVTARAGEPAYVNSIIP